VKAMILAAGRGQRLDPLTTILPKPLFPVLNKPVLAWILEYLAKFSVKEIIINLYHLAPQIHEAMKDGSLWGIKLFYSYETQILGTAGGVKKVEEFLKGGTFILYNGDTLVDLDLTEALAFHRAKGALATLVVREDKEAPQYGLIRIGSDGRVIQFLDHSAPIIPERTYETMFTGIHILEPDILMEIPANQYCGFSEEVYPNLIRKGYPVYGYLFNGYWIDIGTPEKYFKANKDFLGKTKEAITAIPNGLGKEIKIFSPVILGDNTTLQDSCSLGPYSIIGDNCSIGKRSKVQGCILWSNVTLAHDVRVKNAIIAPGVYLPPGTMIEDRIVIKVPEEQGFLSQPLSSSPLLS